MPLRTQEQNIKLHTFLAKLEVKKEEKVKMVNHYTAGRTDTSAELLTHECEAMISELKNRLQLKEAVEDKKRKRVISHLIEAGFVHPETGKADMHRIYKWAYHQKHKKRLNDLTSPELSQLIVAAEKVKNHHLKKLQESRS